MQIENVIDNKQLAFPYLEAAEVPQLAPIDDIQSFECELDAINYCFDIYKKKHGRSMAQSMMAKELRTTPQVISKLLQGDCAMPRNKILKFCEVCKSWALLQWYNFRAGLVVRSKEHAREQRDNDARKDAYIAELEQRLEAYKRAVGE